MFESHLPSYSKLLLICSVEYSWQIQCKSTISGPDPKEVGEPHWGYQPVPSMGALLFPTEKSPCKSLFIFVLQGSKRMSYSEDTSQTCDTTTHATKKQEKKRGTWKQKAERMWVREKIEPLFNYTIFQEQINNIQNKPLSPPLGNAGPAENQHGYDCCAIGRVHTLHLYDVFRA